MTKNGKYFIFFCENIAQSLRVEFGGYYSKKKNKEPNTMFFVKNI